MTLVHRLILVGLLAALSVSPAGATPERVEERSYVGISGFAPFFTGPNACPTPDPSGVERRACFELRGATRAVVEIADQTGFDVFHDVQWCRARSCATYNTCGDGVHGEGTQESWWGADHLVIVIFGVCRSPLPLGAGTETVGTVRVRLT